ncbi:MAG: FG-GAP-like repeat-containing protein, partial [Salinivirgaceae bacterium]|nr:FG-GAP-like repeat-containing protein [Salinivirgaceae bacterium]
MKKLISFIILSLAAMSLFAQENAEGSISGSFNVSPTGAAIYDIPIHLPTGKGGLTPSISITYSSQGGAGLLGQGFQLTGISSISRVSKSFFRDGVSKPIAWDETDRYVLDGCHLLHVGDNEFKTETETFSKIIKTGTGNNTVFKVYTKDGRTIFYEAKSKFNASGTTKILSWYPNKIVDALGNIITITYNGLYQNLEEITISKILYSGYTVDFDFDPITPKHDVFINGARIRRDKQLQSITIKIDNSTVSTYGFTYENGLLVSVSNEGLYSEKKQDKLFEWAESGLSTPSLVSTLDQANGKYRFGDFNGDGKTDWVQIDSGWWGIYLSTGSGFMLYIDGRYGDEFRDFIPADVNNDGKLDFILHTRSNHTNYFKHYVINSDGTYTLIYTDEFFQTTVDRDLDLNMNVGDFDGDGLTDYAVFHSGVGVALAWTGKCVGYKLSSGYSYSANLQKTWIPFHGYSYTVPNENDHCFGFFMPDHKMFLDYNGDGKIDILYVKDLLCYIWTFNGSSWVNIANSNGFLPTKWHKIYTGDYNGDGLPDLLACGDDNDFQMFENDGTKWLWPSNTKPSFPDYTDKTSIHFTDLTGDGKDDVLFMTYNATTKKVNFDYRISKGNRIDWIAESKEKWFNSMCWEDLSNVQFADFNGDGISDYFLGLKNIHHAVLGNYRKPKIAKIKDSGSEYNKFVIGSRPLSMIPLSELLTTTSQAGIINVVPAIDVVTMYYTSDETAGVYMLYNYSKAKVHRGKGFLGFEKIVGTNQETQIRTEKTFEIVTPGYFSMLKSVKCSYGPQPISESASVNKVLVRSFNNKTWYYPYVESTTTDNLITGFTNSIGYREIDIYGNVGRTTKKTGGTIFETVVNTYTQPANYG